VVAETDVVAVEVQRGVVDVLVAEATEDVEVVVERDRAAGGVAVGVDIAVGGLVAGGDVVVGDAFGCIGGERNRRRHGHGDQDALHLGESSVSCALGRGPATGAGEGREPIGEIGYRPWPVDAFSLSKGNAT